MMIAASIIYTGVEVAIAPASRWRVALAFGFGLVHGVAPLPAGAPVVACELGVVAGAFAVALVALPVLYALALFVGGERYRRLVVPLVAIAAFVGGVCRVM
jgi:hypothetical protein